MVVAFLLLLVSVPVGAQTQSHVASASSYLTDRIEISPEAVPVSAVSFVDEGSPADRMAIERLVASARRDAAAVVAPEWYASAGGDRGTLTITVNTLAGDNDGACGIARGEDCSLLEAVALANVNPDFTAIAFSISGTIALSEPLVLLESTHLDGTTAPGGAGSVFLDGQDSIENVVTVADGAGTVIEGLTIGQSAQSGILILAPASDVSVVGNYIGTNAAGDDLGNNTTISGNAGIRVNGALNTRIGGTLADESNVIGFNRSGINLEAGSIETVIQGNYIGTNAAGANLGNTLSGVFISGPSSTVGGTMPGAGNVLGFNGDSGLVVSGSLATETRIEGNFVGTNAAGANLGNGNSGIVIFGASFTVIGGTSSGAGNVIGFNLGDGIAITRFGDPVSGNVVQGNFIGTNAMGANLANGRSGIAITDATDNTVGGTVQGAGNVIGFNARHGVFVGGFNEPTTGNLIAGNWIGTSSAGAALGNILDGIFLQDASDTIIGGSDPRAGNVVGFNVNFGIRILSTGTQPSTGNSLQGNFLGTNQAGSNLGNGAIGVVIVGVSGTIVGGSAPGEGNTIGFNEAGIVIESFNDQLALDNVVQGNFVGTNTMGANLGNELVGISIFNSSNNTVGGSAPGAGNTIGFNATFGIVVAADDGTTLTTGNLILGNFVGTSSAGAAIGNLMDGIFLDGATGNTIGGSAPGAGNTIGFNLGSGVLMADSTTQGNAILSNAIFDNVALGIDLSAVDDLGDGVVTPNDGCGDPDAGPNGFQNFPALVSAQVGGSTMTIDFDLDTIAGDYRVEFFLVPAADPSGHGEGNTFLSAEQVSVSATCDEVFQVELAVDAFDGSTGLSLTATATPLDVGQPSGFGGTSEFSAAVLVEIVDPVFGDRFELGVD